LNKAQKSGLSKFSSISKRAEFIAKAYLKNKYSGCTFVATTKGADLTLKTKGGKKLDFEVKGTKHDGIYLNNIKVSSQDSYNLITKDKITVLRVMLAETDKPKIAEMKHDIHFKLKREPRWTACIST